jgi:hypothetical protein
MMRLAICPAMYSSWLVQSKLNSNLPLFCSGTRTVSGIDSITGFLLVVQQRRGHWTMARRRVQPPVSQGLNTGLYPHPSKRGDRLLPRLVLFVFLNDATECHN